MQSLVDTKSLNIVKSIANEWQPKFEYYSCRIGEIEANNNGNDDNYFSEIEMFIWKGNEILNVFNIIIFLNGERTLTFEEIAVQTKIQLEKILEEIINKVV